MRTLVTGGAGFIGSHICDRLVEMGCEVTVIDNESTGLREFVPPQARYIRGDLRSVEDVGAAFEPVPDAVFHIAAQASNIASFSNPGNDAENNIVGTVNVLQQCIARRVPRLLYASSMTVYGHPEHIPTAEWEPCRPISYYGITKYAAERFVHATAERTDLDFDFNATSFRMFNVYGPRQRLDNPYQGVIGIFVGNVMRDEPVRIDSDGEQSRDFIYIQDVVDAWAKAIDRPSTYGQVYNLGTGRRLTVNQVVDATLECFGHTRENYPIEHAPVRPGDQRHMQADVRKAWAHLHWVARTPLELGLMHVVNWAGKNYE